MKKILFVILLFGTMITTLSPINAASNQTLPCSLILHAASNDNTNALGVALVYQVELLPSFPRTSINILGTHLPDPATLGNYDSYEGYAFVPDLISWRFKLYKATEESAAIWAGKIDDITLGLEHATIQIRLSNSETNELGPEIVSGAFEFCK